MYFWKYHGNGNDFIIVEVAEREFAHVALSAERIRDLCDRNRGIGADGVLFVHPASDRFDGGMVVRNADGSTSEMCGNGLRCVALHVGRRLQKEALLLETDAGPREGHILGGLGTTSQVRVDLGRVTRQEAVTFPTSEGETTFHTANVGNPHAVRLGPWNDELVRSMGPFAETHSVFPHGTNVEFADVKPSHIDLVVWERGVGRTQACGTGAAATATIAWELGQFPRGRTEIRVPGGSLFLTPTAGGTVTLEGAVHLVFEGTLRA